MHVLILRVIARILPTNPTSRYRVSHSGLKGSKKETQFAVICLVKHWST
jgi:hypothetical protein